MSEELNDFIVEDVADRGARNIKVYFLKRLFETSDSYNSIVDFLIDENVLTEADKQHMRSDLQKERSIYAILRDAQKQQILQLASYEWSLLPFEHMKLTIIGKRSTFEYSSAT